MDMDDLTTLLNTCWTLYQMYKEWQSRQEEKSPKPKDKRRKRKSKDKRRRK